MLEGLNKEFNLQQRGKERGPDNRLDLYVDLEDLYNGLSKTIDIEKTLFVVIVTEQEVNQVKHNNVLYVMEEVL